MAILSQNLIAALLFVVTDIHIFNFIFLFTYKLYRIVLRDTSNYTVICREAFSFVVRERYIQRADTLHRMKLIIHELCIFIYLTRQEMYVDGNKDGNLGSK